MIPISLTFEGIFSYQTPQFIDFQNLTSAGLFGIFGKVGAGKSTIVEAMTYALYGQNFRLSSDNNANLVNLSSQKLYIAYIFSLGAEKYRFEIEIKRNSKKFSEVKTTKKNAYKWDNINNDWSPIEYDAKKVLGIKYEDFRRTVIIPQGNFQEFLELKPADRNAMLQELFELGKFDIVEKVKKVRDITALKINAIQTKLEPLNAINEATLATLQNDIVTANDTSQKIKQQLEDTKNQLEQITLIQKAIDEATQKNNKFEQLKQQKSAFDERETALELFQKVQNTVAHTLTALQEASTEKERINTQLQEKIQQLTTLKNELSLAEKALQKAQDNAAQNDFIKTQIVDFEIGIKILDNIQKQNALLKNQTQISEQQKTQQAKQSDLEAELLTHKKALAELKTSGADAFEIQDKINWWNTQEQLQAELHTNQGEKEKHSHLLDTLNKEKTSLAEASATTPIDNIIQQIDNEIQHCQAQIAEVQQQRIPLIQRQALSKQAHQLIDGSPCPLCGALEHPDPLSDDDTIKKLLDENAVTEKNILQQIKTLETRKSSLLVLQNKYDTLNEQINLLAQKETAWQQKHEQHQADYHWKKLPEENKTLLLNLLETLKAQQQLKDSLENKIAFCESELQKINTEKATYDSQLQALHNEISSIKAVVAEQAASLKATTIDTIQQMSPTTIQQQMKQLTTVLEENQHTLTQKTQQLQSLEIRKAAEQATIDQLDITLKKAKEQYNIAHDKVFDALKAADIDSVQTARNILAQSINIMAEKTDINTYRQSLLVAQNEAAQANALLVGKTYHPEQHQALQQQTDALEQSYKAQEQKVWELNRDYNEKQIGLASKKELQKTLESLSLRQQNINTLEQLFKAKAFVNYVASVYLENLLRIANERFRKMTMQQLSLQLTADNNFEIIDLLNEGKARSIRTLSGGQKFQAALALSLALADSIARPDRENFFFIDEGFGSLDKDSLQIVFETLQALRNENRIVGIISHVEEMQLEIERYILVKLDKQHGSHLEVV